MLINIEMTVFVPEPTDLEKAIDRVEAAARAAGLEICFESNAAEIQTEELY